MTSRNHLIGRFVLAGLLLGLSACATLPPAGAPQWQEQRAGLLGVQEWELRGRIAVKSAAEGGQAKLLWRQQGDSSRMRVSGPFGVGAYELVWEPELVSLTDAGGERSIEYHGTDAAEDFMRDQLGWSFPAGSARYWVLGLPDPSADGQEFFDDSGVLSGIHQHGWDVRYERFGEYDGYSLPNRLSMENGTASLRIVVSKWAVIDAGD